jgi:hypothetical protein
MYLILVGAIVFIGCIVGFFGIVFFARDLLQEVEEAARSLPSEDLGHALDMVDEGE